ncbi:hemin uptake protein HemP [Aeoliella mucimassa]|uniref:Hemin uptake protein hemP n=1 Tax=Aeoliella mucimassa TaxID=2527972 RepID=A0A518ASE4_9BACT|nr:hemin uptake protein HemP [Aeoliella mucimassa]QDU57645.1 hypothetical protein Pan181_38640 [Aeoliella mucimassa]
MSEREDHKTPTPNEPEQRIVTSSELMQGGRTLLIEHTGQIYRLTITKNDKLILQK